MRKRAGPHHRPVETRRVRGICLQSNRTPPEEHASDRRPGGRSRPPPRIEGRTPCQSRASVARSRAMHCTGRGASGGRRQRRIRANVTSCLPESGFAVREAEAQARQRWCSAGPRQGPGSTDGCKKRTRQGARGLAAPALPRSHSEYTRPPHAHAAPRAPFPAGEPHRRSPARHLSPHVRLRRLSRQRRHLRDGLARGADRPPPPRRAAPRAASPPRCRPLAPPRHGRPAVGARPRVLPRCPGTVSRPGSGRPTPRPSSAAPAPALRRAKSRPAAVRRTQRKKPPPRAPARKTRQSRRKV